MQKQPVARPFISVRVLWTSAFSVFLVSITVLGYIENLKLFSFFGFAITIYGIITIVHVSMQMCFATLNRRKIRRLVQRSQQEGFVPATSLMSVGYREAPTLLRNHFLSIQALRFLPNGHVFVGDGNEEASDLVMGDIFREMFPQGIVLNVPFVLCEANASQKAWLYDTIWRANPTHLCILQPHRDKRHAMYTAMRLLTELKPITAIVMTDSDTVLDKDVVRQLTMPFVDPRVGAVTGDVKILNVVNYLSLLSSVRYWFAFNLERAAQSFWGVVNCVSGPLGAYRSDVIREVLDDWMQQTFLGERCTYGDDRHLTNLTLRNRWQVLYTPFASCQTETPTTLWRWVRQQIRWNRSFYREMIFNFKWAHKHPLWLTYDLTYQTLFPALLLIGMAMQVVFAVHTRSFVPTLVFVTSLLLGGGFRSLYSYLLTRDPRKFCLAFYGFLYIIFLLPARLWALATLWHTTWGTSARGLLTAQPRVQEWATPGTGGS